MYYPAIFTPDTNGTLLVTFRDIPEAVSVGDDIDNATSEALDALETAFSIYMDERRAIPAPSTLQDGEHAIYLPARVCAKIALYHEMLEQHVTKAELARRLSMGQKQVDRLWDLSHSSKLEALENAFAVLGKRLDLAVI